MDAAAAPVAGEARPSPWPIAAALLAGAAIGAVVGVVFYRSEANGPDPQIAALSAKVAALEARKPAEPDLGPLKAQITDLQAKVADAQKTAAAAKTGDDTSALQQKLGSLEQSVAALQKQGVDTKDVDAKLAQVDTKLAQATSGLDGVKQQAAANASDLQALKDQQKSLAGKVGAPALAVVADSLVQAIDAGQPYVQQVDALETLGADPTKIAILKQNAQTGVASARTLALKLTPLEEPMLATTHKPPANASFMQKIESGMSSLVSVRRTTDVTGSDASSRIARIKADLAHDDLADASSTWDALPADAKAKSEAWGALAKTSAAALTAARGLQADAISALGGKKS